MESEGVSLPLIHEHVMMPLNNLRKGDCCGRCGFTSGGYYCKSCDFFVHRKCVDESPEYIEHSSHAVHPLKLQTKPHKDNICDLCQERIVNLCYRCEICDFDVDLFCAQYQPPWVIAMSEPDGFTRCRDKELLKLDCVANCGRIICYEYYCKKWGLAFHVDCLRNRSSVTKDPSEVNHTYHPLHPLKLYEAWIRDVF
ncbi:PREDICTED: uncharacterized protein LOC104718721 isoform X2 [Camelina sativa]|uniref:Uncharacterized protein LOC104718721 isoform X2 n=1 Tax=Camelina sativa TaxID=90675 RepID=A0ABM0U2E1_CAMSA|nr:PREDICTED: uncharacterized protein LOC104718721 isoform X2 [Camelina sativa]